MKINTKFNFEDTVFKIIQAHRTEHVPCDCCGGKGEIKVHHDKIRICPDCYGRKGANVNKAYEWMTPDTTLTIGQIRVTATCAYINDSIFSNYGSQEEERKEEYMCYETGIGSGSVYSADNLFLTKEKAQSECNRRNQREKEKEEKQ